jgi:hypothetical protein
MRSFLRFVFLVLAAAASIATSPPPGWRLTSELTPERVELAPGTSVTRKFTVLASQRVDVAWSVLDLSQGASVHVSERETQHGWCVDDTDYGSGRPIGGTCPVDGAERYDFEVRISNEGEGSATFTLDIRADIYGTDDDAPPGAHVEVLPSHEP